MCGRFALTLPTDAVAGWFEAVHVKAMWDQPRYNICPTQDIPVAVNYEGARHLVPMRWGFIPKWYKSPTDGPMIINARSETITEKRDAEENALKAEEQEKFSALVALKKSDRRALVSLLALLRLDRIDYDEDDEC